MSAQDNTVASVNPNPDVIEVKASVLSPLQYTTTLIFARTKGTVGGPILPGHPLSIEVETHGSDKLAIIIRNETNLRSLLELTPLGNLLDQLYAKCYAAYHNPYRSRFVEIKERLELTPEQSAQLSQAIILLLLNYSNTPLSEIRKQI